VESGDEAAGGLIAPDPGVPDLLAHGASRFPGRPCVVVGDSALDFAQVSSRAALFAGHLSERGLGGGRRIAVLAQNELELLEIRVASQRAGAILVPLNYRLDSAELARALRDCAADLLIVGPRLRELAAELDGPDVMHLGGSRTVGGTSDGSASGEGDDTFDVALSYERALSRARPQPVPATLPAEAIGMISYTSGTTGRAKGAMLSNRALHATMIAMGQEMAARPDAIYLCSNPLFHVGSAVACAFTYLGATCIQLTRFSPDAFLRELEAGSFTHGQLVPTMVHDVLELAGGCSTGRLERLMYGAAPMPPELVRRVMAAWRCELVNGYGSTEAMGISMLSPAEHDPDGAPARLASVGRGCVGMSARLVDEHDLDVVPGVVGEVIAQGPNLMSGYWNDPAASGEALRGGWMHTGDLGYRDGDGYLFLVDRRSDRIVTGGENVYPSEIEHVLMEHAAVLEAGVLGVPHERWGEAVCAVVVLRDRQAVSERELLDHCRARLAGYKVPKRLRFGDALPRTATGKLLRRELRVDWSV